MKQQKKQPKGSFYVFPGFGALLFSTQRIFDDAENYLIPENLPILISCELFYWEY